MPATAKKIACCSPSRARMKVASFQKAKKAADDAAKSGKGIKKAAPKKASARKATAKKAKPCQLCGKYAKQVKK